MPFDNANVPESPRTRALRRARNLIAKGWVAGIRQSGNNYCALGALDRTCPMSIRVSTEDFLGTFATFRGHDKCNNTTVHDWSNSHQKIAAHSNMTGQMGAVEMFDNAIAASVELDMMNA